MYGYLRISVFEISLKLDTCLRDLQIFGSESDHTFYTHLLSTFFYCGVKQQFFFSPLLPSPPEHKTTGDDEEKSENPQTFIHPKTNNSQISKIPPALVYHLPIVGIHVFYTRKLKDEIRKNEEIQSPMISKKSLQIPGTYHQQHTPLKNDGLVQAIQLPFGGPKGKISGASRVNFQVGILRFP